MEGKIDKKELNKDFVNNKKRGSPDENRGEVFNKN